MLGSFSVITTNKRLSKKVLVKEKNSIIKWFIMV